ncbi:MAG: T9SS type A sorting domain-containing protein [Bacteroidetes bacterium]|nr:T9SS type A sorting domain-containing protein [Bacteroidota bacterium]
MGIEEGKLSNNQLNIYANPNDGTCFIQIPDDLVNDKNVTLSIYDASGKLIQQQLLQSNDEKLEINIEKRAKGVYPVVLSNLKKSYNGKIIFE